VSPTAAYLLETLVTLLGVVVVAVVVLVGAKRLGVGAPSGPLELVGRLPLDARRAVYLVRVGENVLVLGSSEAGLVKLSEVPRAELPAPVAAPTRSFGEVLRRLATPPRAAVAKEARGEDA
jgi:flagellar protein FliO/FliZ